MYHIFLTGTLPVSAAGLPVNETAIL